MGLGQSQAGEASAWDPESTVLPVRGWRQVVSTKVVVFGFVLLGLLGIVTFAAIREAAMPPPSTRVARPALAPPRPPLTRAEEEYALALWPIHNEVKAGALKMTLTGLAYKLGELDRTELKTRVDRSVEIYGQAARRIAALSPPPSLAGAHEMYRDAVRLYQRSAAEMLRVAGDGRDEHLVVAQPLSLEASEKLLKVGDVLWPNEYKPN